MSGQVTVSEFLVSLIKSTGVDTVPLVTGGAIMKVVDDVGQNPDLEYICANHEQAVAMMVDAYSKIKGFGVGMATSGPGGGNLVTGIMCAYQDSIPCLFFTGQVGRFHLKGDRRVRQRGFQEVNIVDIVRPITKYATVLMDPNDARMEFEKAVHLAKSGRPGPVLIDLPYDVQRALICPDALRGYGNYDYRQPTDVGRIWNEVRQAERPVVLIGGGVRLADRVGTIRQLVDLLQIPVITTWATADAFDYGYSWHAGSVGCLGNSSANMLIQQSDCVLALGTRHTTKHIIDEKEFARNARVITVDIDRGELEDGLIDSNTKLEANLRWFLPALLDQVLAANEQNRDWGEWRNNALRMIHENRQIISPECREGFVDGYAFIDALSSELSENDIFVADAGVNVTWAAQAYRPKRGQRFLSAWGCSPMGYAVPAAMGAWLANPNVNVVATIGDGGMQMNIQELQTIAVNKIPIKIFILNNRCYGNIMHPTRELFEGRTHATEPGMGYEAPDFIKIAYAYGIKRASLLSWDNLREEIGNILAMDEPVLVDVDCDPEQFVFDNCA